MMIPRGVYTALRIIACASRLVEDPHDDWCRGLHSPRKHCVPSRLV